MERRGRYRQKEREESAFLQLQATHRLWSLHQKPANERVTVTGSALSSVCQQKIQMKEFTQTGLTAHEAASEITMLNDSVEGFDLVPVLAPCKS